MEWNLKSGTNKKTAPKRCRIVKFETSLVETPTELAARADGRGFSLAVTL